MAAKSTLAAGSSSPTEGERPVTLYCVFATSYENDTFRVSDPASWDRAQAEWTKLDELLRSGRTPEFKFFEVRTVWFDGDDIRSHDRYDRAPVLIDVRRSTNSRGFKKPEDAARA